MNESWWWFSVSGDQQRYAPFRTSSSDTRKEVQSKIVEFYEHRLWAKSQPVQKGAHWGRKPDAAPAKKPPAKLEKSSQRQTPLLV